MNTFNLSYESLTDTTFLKIIRGFGREELNDLVFNRGELEFLGFFYDYIDAAILDCFEEQIEKLCDPDAEKNREEYKNRQGQVNDLIREIAHDTSNQLKIFLKVEVFAAKLNELKEAEKQLTAVVSEQLKPVKEKTDGKGLEWIEKLDEMLDILPEQYTGKRIIYEARLRADII